MNVDFLVGGGIIISHHSTTKVCTIMTDYTTEFNQLIQNVSSALGKKIDPTKYEIIDRGVPHRPPTLPPGKMGIYTFLYKGRFLKIGKAGASSGPRFSSHHYNPNSSQSTLAASLLDDAKMVNKVNKANVKDWIMNNCQRIDVIIDEKLGVFALALIEAALHYCYEPKYEGFPSQRKK